jgi:hypothetical protein
MKKYIFLLALLHIAGNLAAQKTDSLKKNLSADSLLNSMTSDGKKEPVTVFKSSRLILSQTTETVKKKNFNFDIIHRFGDFSGTNGGARFAYGLDDVADVTFRFEYGLSDDLNIDLERSTISGLIDLELKYAMLHQTADGSSPIAITVLGETGVRPFGSFDTFDSRLSYFAQAIFAHRFSSGFSLQVAPSFVTSNTPYPAINGIEQQFVSLSAAARLKITNHMGFVVDYAHPFSAYRDNGVNRFSDPFGFGVEMVTGGHVFTVNITNARANSEINYLNNTMQDYARGQYRVGFTISRMFDFNHKESYKTAGNN